jgi:hypothetical protein
VAISFGDHRIVVNTDIAALDDACVDSNSRHGRLAIEQQGTCLREVAPAASSA